MAENKKSFIAYSDWYGMFKALPDDVAGKLIKHVFSYVNDENPESDDYVINALFEQIKATLKRDLDKWDKQREQRSKAGKKSAEIRATKKNERSTTVNEKQRKATVSVSVSDSVNEIIDKSITIEKEEKIFLDKREIYRTYAIQLSTDMLFIEAVSRNHIKHSNNEVNKKTIHKYLKIFLTHLDETKEVHNNKKDFQNHFSNWLRKQTIELASIKTPKLRYS